MGANRRHDSRRGLSPARGGAGGSFGHGSYGPFLLFYAPLTLVWPSVAFLAGPGLHVAYAICADRIRSGRLDARWLGRAAGIHYLAALALSLGLGWDRRFGQVFDAYLARAFDRTAAWLLSGVAVFVGWQLWLAAGALSKPRMW